MKLHTHIAFISTAGDDGGALRAGRGEEKSQMTFKDDRNRSRKCEPKFSRNKQLDLAADALAESESLMMMRGVRHRGADAAAHAAIWRQVLGSVAFLTMVATNAMDCTL